MVEDALRGKHQGIVSHESIEHDAWHARFAGSDDARGHAGKEGKEGKGNLRRECRSAVSSPAWRIVPLTVVAAPGILEMLGTLGETRGASRALRAKRTGERVACGRTYRKTRRVNDDDEPPGVRTLPS